MLDADAVLTQVKQKTNPSSWHIYYGKGSPVVMALLFGIFALIFTGICEMITSAALITFGFFNLSTPSFASFNPVQLLLSLGTVGLFIPLIVAVAAAIFVGYRMARAKDSVLVLLPEGVVQCTGWSNPSHRSVQVLDYADVASMNLKVRTTTTHDEATHMSSASTHFGLDILRRDTSKHYWPIDSCYGPPETIAQDIISDYARYTPLQSIP